MFLEAPSSPSPSLGRVLCCPLPLTCPRPRVSRGCRYRSCHTWIGLGVSKNDHKEMHIPVAFHYFFEIIYFFSKAQASRKDIFHCASLCVRSCISCILSSFPDLKNVTLLMKSQTAFNNLCVSLLTNEVDELGSRMWFRCPENRINIYCYKMLT